MYILSSLLFGSQGRFNIYGITVECEADPEYVPASIDGAGSLSALAQKCLTSPTFRLLTQGYLHTFFHEMGHAFIRKFLTGQNSRILIETNTGTGRTYSRSSQVPCDWKQSSMDAAGTLVNTAFSMSKLMAAVALKNYLPLPVTLLLGGGAVMWIAGELLYTYTSIKQEDYDFGEIAKRNKTHLIIVCAALTSEIALGTLVIIGLTKAAI